MKTVGVVLSVVVGTAALMAMVMSMDSLSVALRATSTFVLLVLGGLVLPVLAIAPALRKASLRKQIREVPTDVEKDIGKLAGGLVGAVGFLLLLGVSCAVVVTVIRVVWKVAAWAWR